MNAMKLAVAQADCCWNIAITLIDLFWSHVFAQQAVRLALS